ncbi:MFS transporter [Kribbella sp.]|uniref:MFS transporter n=1 Tax=Kribbella sp. TaxID=1871183 RepID=UPI002D348E03|nr:MFS transporter [Kribbella sp.]HZX09081.1 MFS transporter [Kribbella sp.]
MTVLITRNRGAVLAVLLTGQFMANIDTAVANIAGPSVGTDLGASAGAVGLVVSGYVVAFAVLLITGARLGTSFGYRRTFLLGLTVFTAASLACGLAPGIGALVGARFVQGAGAALMVPQVLSGIQLHFHGRDRLKALGYFSIALSGGAVAGQLLGGVLIAANLFGTSWRPIFLVNVPIGVALLIAGRRLLPPELPGRRDRLDLGGVLVLCTTVLLVIVPLLLGAERGWPTWSWLCLLLSLPALLLFEYGERRTAARGGRPLIAREVLGSSSVRAGLLAHGCTSGSYFALLFVLALYLQGGLHKGPAYSGFAMVVWVAAFGLAGPVLPRLRRGVQWMPVVGCLVLAMGYVCVLVYLMLGGRSGPLLFVLLGVGGLGLGISANTLIGAVTSSLPPEYAADLSGVVATNAQLSGALGVAVAGSAYTALAADPGRALSVVLAGFAVLAVVGAAAAQRLVR